MQTRKSTTAMDARTFIERHHRRRTVSENAHSVPFGHFYDHGEADTASPVISRPDLVAQRNASA